MTENENKDDLREAKIEAKLEEARVEAKLEEAKVEAHLKEAKIEAKLEEAEIEAKVEEAKCGKKKCCGLGICKRSCKNKGIVIIVAVLALIVSGSFWFKSYWSKVDVGKDTIKSKVEKFISDKVPAGVKVEIKDVAKEGDLYKITLSAQGQDVPMYMTRDGKKLIQAQGVIDIDAEPSKDDKSAQAQQAPKDIPKSDVPEVKLFVMSYCPYGTQMEKGILPVLDALGSKIKYTLEFVDYAMHDQKEIDENLRQYCIQKNKPTKLNAYLGCFLKKGQGTESSCLASAGLNAAQITTCMQQTDKQFGVTEGVKDKSKWSGGQFPPFDVNKDENQKYGVEGSPTLVVNGVVANPAGRDSASILKTVCGAFNNPPKECQKQLSTTAPAAGFGDGAATGGASNASCGN